jgi:hypothetical protein
MASSMFVKPPDRIHRSDTVVMQQTTVDDLMHIQQLWPAFETLVGLWGRKMYGYVDLAQNTYTACTPVRDGDEPDELGLRRARCPAVASCGAASSASHRGCTNSSALA